MKVHSGEDVHLVMGGTFDPIHHGHLRIAIELRERLAATCVTLIPSHTPPHRATPGASAVQRLAMLRLAIEGESGLQVDTCELDRQGPSYTVDTLRSLRMRLGEQVPIALVLGADAFNGLPLWHSWMDIPALAHIIVVQRPGHVLSLDTHPASAPFTSAEELSALRAQPAGWLVSAALPLLDISATDIRARVQSGLSPRYLLPDAVCSYIRQHRLYRPQA